MTAVAYETPVETLVDESPYRKVRAAMNTSYAADLWLSELERKGHSPSSIDAYRRLLYRLADQHPTHKDVRDLTSVDVRAFVDLFSRRKDGKGRVSDSTVAQSISMVNGFFDWLTFENIIDRNPTRRNGMRILARPRKPDPVENDNVVTISSDDVRRLLREAEAGGKWNEWLCVACLAYLGPRRSALAKVRLEDYDQVDGTITFREKGSKTIAKPVPTRLGEILDRAINAGVYSTPRDYLIPNYATARNGDRDDRIIYHIVKKVAYRARVDTHVHALRAAFAVYFLESNPGESVGLQKLMGHKRPETTQVYLRRLDRRLAMESVRDLSWDDVSSATSEKSFDASFVTEKEGFEPSTHAFPRLVKHSLRLAGPAPRETLH